MRQSASPMAGSPEQLHLTALTVIIFTPSTHICCLPPSLSPHPWSLHGLNHNHFPAAGLLSGGGGSSLHVRCQWEVFIIHFLSRFLIWFDMILFWGPKFKEIPPLTPLPLPSLHVKPPPYNPRPKKGEKYVDLIFTWQTWRSCWEGQREVVNSLWGSLTQLLKHPQQRINRNSAKR